MTDLYLKYLQNVPRYATYPTAKDWSNKLGTSDWIECLSEELSSDKPIGLYIHIPFCEDLCGFCGCNTTITKDHSIEENYISALKREWEYYKASLPLLDEIQISQVYIGGGTPNFFSASNLRKIIALFRENFSNNFSGIIEIDPRKLTEEQAGVFKAEGFDTVSMGVQDITQSVLSQVRPDQCKNVVKSAVSQLRKHDIDTISFDLMYGLPGQTSESWAEALEQIFQINPDRISLYRWVSPKIESSTKKEISPNDEWEMYSFVRSSIIDAGYVDIGMDHFVSKEDPLYSAQKSKTLNKSFSCYHDKSHVTTIGLGVSAISETTKAFHQNEKALPAYFREIDRAKIPTHRGLRLSNKQMEVKKKIFQLSTDFETTVESDSIANELSEIFENKLAEYKDGMIKIPEEGRPFLRPICQKIEASII